MPDDELLQRIRHFHHNAFPQYRAQFQALVQDGQHPTTLFIGCSDSRLLPYLLTGAGLPYRFPEGLIPAVLDLAIMARLTVAA